MAAYTDGIVIDHSAEAVITMHFLFIDESGTPPKKDKKVPKPYFVIAGVTIPEGQWHGICSDLAQLKNDAQFRVRGEIKWRFFGPTNADRDNPLMHLSDQQRALFRDKFFGIITRRNSVKIIACVASVASCYRTTYITDDETLYQYTYKPVSERFQYYLQDLGRTAGSEQFGIIVADHRGRKQDEAFRRHHQRLLDQNGIFMAQYKNVLESIFLTPSHLSVGIQFADMVAGAIGRKFNTGDGTCYSMIEGSFRRSPNGTPDGYGLVKMPTMGWK